ncbi:winged helix-turn-helix transcriptional regulator [Amorphoplanes digitatis]|uniref:DNA-binding HxlR family transcriptional regulator n=1 Tax=Actinoplanes digitatis TaxID=1868 RepID=A0A7W7HX51_9ACTN|nr:helix-turn-helix domain-containing protein [Actinoplanes digitatis]MBB4762422.1 DNA-binding HxlR family transcriptional regulator [Actinoplanes digitatis]GID92455.1 transcriptional regulator [Actinoplanes digitatis]
MRGYGQYCPLALAAEVFAERWTPIIIRNLSLGCTHFNEILDGAPGLSRSVLSQRLRLLERTGVVGRTRTGRSTAYGLTVSGRELAGVCLALGAWGARWRQVRPEDQDPYLALWTLSRMIDPATLPRPRVVVLFHITGHRAPNRFWLVLAATGNEVCVSAPGYPEDGQVTTDVAGLVRWYAGEATLGAVQRAGGMAVRAPGWLVRELAGWGALSPYARTG